VELLSERYRHEADDGSDEPVSPVPSTPRYVVVMLARDEAEIVAQGTTSAHVFQRLFLDRYELGGERYHPGDHWTVHGALLATHGSTVVAVPVWTWTGRDGRTRFLCQATDDGSPPAVSVFAFSESDLLDQLTGQLQPSTG
jgi:hypothetical protein